MSRTNYSGDNFIQPAMTCVPIGSLIAVIEQLNCPECKVCHGSGTVIGFKHIACRGCDGTGRERTPL